MSSHDERSDVSVSLDSTDASVLRQLHEAGWWGDVLILAFLPVVLVVTFTLPLDAKLRLALEYANPTVVSAFTSHFVHLSEKHLAINLLGSLIVVPTGYLLSVLGGRRRQFLTVFACFVFAFPFALSGLNLLFVRPGVGIGFSGIVLAFVGYLGIALLDFCGERYEVPVDGTRSAWLFFLALALIAYDLPVYGPTLALVALLTSLVFGSDLAFSLGWDELARVGSAAANDVGGNLVVLGATVFLVYPVVSITTTPATANGTINVYAHVLGFCLGYIATYVTILLDGLD